MTFAQSDDEKIKTKVLDKNLRKLQKKITALQEENDRFYFENVVADTKNDQLALQIEILTDDIDIKEIEIKELEELLNESREENNFLLEEIADLQMDNLQYEKSLEQCKEERKQMKKKIKEFCQEYL